MELVKPGININFVGMMKGAVIFSVILSILCLGSIAMHKGFNYGIDFAGGTLVQLKFKNQADADKIRAALNTIGLTDSILQPFGTNEVVVRTAQASSEMKGLSGRIEESLNKAFGKGSFEIRRIETVGPKVGKDLTRKAIYAVLFSWLGMLIYVAFRFELRYAVGGIIAIIHDVIVVLGALSILNKEFTLTVVAAVLTVIGYSMHDTIVVYDRIRENIKRDPRKDLRTVVNESTNQTLSRTILTSFTVFLVVVILFLFGGEVIHDFAFILVVGVIIGTYSSVFIASPFVLAWEDYRIAKEKGKR